MALRILVSVSICLVYFTHAQIDENNLNNTITTTNIEEQAVEELTIKPQIEADPVIVYKTKMATGNCRSTELYLADYIHSALRDSSSRIVRNIGVLTERSSHHHHHHVDPTFHGFWKKKFIWRPRWVKTWQEKKIYVAVWKRMWGPAVLNEWVPVPKPPPGWLKHGVGRAHGTLYVKTHPTKPY